MGTTSAGEPRSRNHTRVHRKACSVQGPPPGAAVRQACLAAHDHHFTHPADEELAAGVRDLPC